MTMGFSTSTSPSSCQRRVEHDFVPTGQYLDEGCIRVDKGQVVDVLNTGDDGGGGSDGWIEVRDSGGLNYKNSS